MRLFINVPSNKAAVPWEGEYCFRIYSDVDKVTVVADLDNTR